MPDAQPITDEVIATLIERTRGGHGRVVVVGADRRTYVAWRKHRGVTKQCYWAEDASLLSGLESGSDVSVVLVKGYRSHPKWSQLYKRLQVVGAYTPIWIDELPPDVLPPAPTVGGAHLAGSNRIMQVRPDPDQGDVFILSTNSSSITISRLQAEHLVDLLRGFLESEPVPDPHLDALEERKALIEATGDLYGRERV